MLLHFKWTSQLGICDISGSVRETSLLHVVIQWDLKPGMGLKNSKRCKIDDKWPISERGLCEYYLVWSLSSVSLTTISQMSSSVKIDTKTAAETVSTQAPCARLQSVCELVSPNLSLDLHFHIVFSSSWTLLLEPRRGKMPSWHPEEFRKAQHHKQGVWGSCPFMWCHWGQVWGRSMGPRDCSTYGTLGKKEM